jgi:hypothetical protein
VINLQQFDSFAIFALNWTFKKGLYLRRRILGSFFDEEEFSLSVHSLRWNLRRNSFFQMKKKVNQENEFALSCPWLFFRNE